MAAARRRVQEAHQRMRNLPLQLKEREAYAAKPWEETNRLRVPVNVAKLEAFAATHAAAVVPVRKRVQNNTHSYREIIRRFLRNVERPTPDAEMGSVIVRYEYKKQGRALADAGLIASAWSEQTDYVLD